MGPYTLKPLEGKALEEMKRLKDVFSNRVRKEFPGWVVLCKEIVNSAEKAISLAEKWGFTLAEGEDLYVQEIEVQDINGVKKSVGVTESKKLLNNLMAEFDNHLNTTFNAAKLQTLSCHHAVFHQREAVVTKPTVKPTVGAVKSTVGVAGAAKTTEVKPTEVKPKVAKRTEVKGAKLPKLETQTETNTETQIDKRLESAAMLSSYLCSYLNFILF